MLILKKNKNESWFECGFRIAKEYQLENDYLDMYTESIEMGVSEKNAAFNACWDLDVLDIEPDEKE